MAISLASGVMVSTILTLIVIPLGCIKASKDLIEVAAATAPAGVEVPVLETGTRTDQPKPQKPAAAARTSIWMMIWSKLFAVISTLFYLVRGIFMLLFQLFKKKSKPAKTAPPAAGAVKTHSGSGSAGGGGSSAGGASEPPTASNPPVSKVSQAAPAQTSADLVAEKAPQPPASQGAESSPADAPSRAGDTARPETGQAVSEDEGSKPAATGRTNPSNQAEPVASQVDEPPPRQPPAESTKAPAPQETVPSKTKKRPSTLQNQKAAKDASRDASSKDNGNGSAKKKQSATASEVQNVTAIPMKKKTGRRGIRLKT